MFDERIFPPPKPFLINKKFGRRGYMNPKKQKFGQPALTAARIYKEPELAEILNISSMTLKRIRYAGEISFLRIGTQVRYTESHLESYLEKCQRKSKR